MPADALAAPVCDSANRGRLSRLATRLRHRGVRATARKLFADRIFRRSTSVILEYRAGWGSMGTGEVRPAWLSFAVVRAQQDLPPLCHWMAHRRADFVAMLGAGKLAVFALEDEVAVGCIWVSLDDHHDPVSREFYPVGPNEAYQYCWMVDPSMRRFNVGLPLCRIAMKTLADLGIQRQFGVVDRANRASYVIQMRGGYRECGIRVVHYIILGSRWTRTSRYEGTLGLLPTNHRHPA